MKITEHFFTDSDNSGWDNAPPQAREELRHLATLLEAMRTAGGGVPMVITSGYRVSDPKQHGKGQAADFYPRGVNPVVWAQRVIQAQREGRVPNWGQLIVYPHSTGHIHVSLDRLGASRQNEIRMETGKGVYPHWNGGAVLPWGTPSGGGTVNTGPDREGTASPTWLLWVTLAMVLALYFFGV